MQKKLQNLIFICIFAMISIVFFYEKDYEYRIWLQSTSSNVR